METYQSKWPDLINTQMRNTTMVRLFDKLFSGQFIIYSGSKKSGTPREQKVSAAVTPKLILKGSHHRQHHRRTQECANSDGPILAIRIIRMAASIPGEQCRGLLFSEANESPGAPGMRSIRAFCVGGWAESQRHDVTSDQRASHFCLQDSINFLVGCGNNFLFQRITAKTPQWFSLSSRSFHVRMS
jgi:hypothetical protein